MKLVPKRRFKGFSESWRQFKLDDIGDVVTGSTPPTNDLGNYGGEYPFITPADIKGSRYIKRTNTTLSKKGFSMGRTLKEGAVLFVCIGSTIGKVAQTKGTAITNQQINAILVNDYICEDFIYSLIEYESKRISELAATQAVPILNKTAFSAVKLHLPFLEEQEQIGALFCGVDNLISIHQQKLKKLQALKQAYLHEMFPAEGESVPKRRFAGFEQPWKMKKLDDLGATFSGLLGKTKEDFGKGKAEFVPYLNVFNNPVSDIHYTEQVEIDKRQNEVRFGDVFFTTSSETPEEVGMSSVWLDDRKNVYLNSFCFGYRLRENVEPLFMAYVLRTNPVRNQFVLLAQGISRYNISSRKAMEITINFPELGEQRAIGHFFSLLDKRIEMQEAKIEKLKAMKKAYLEEMFI